MGMDYQQRSEVWVNAHYEESKARGGVGWAHIPDLNRQAADRLEGLIREFGPHGGRALEIGCGAGDMSVLLAPRGLFDEMQGTDISAEAIAWAQEKAKQSPVPMSFAVGNMVDLRGFTDGCYDAVIAFACLHWVIGDEDRRNCLASVRRVLKPGGRFYVHTACRSEEEVSRGDPEGWSYFDPDRDMLMRKGLPYMHLKRPEAVRDEIQAAGFEVLYWDLGERRPEDGPYFAGPLVFVAAKPADAG